MSGTVGASSSISYTIRLNMPGGGSVELSGVRPSTPPLWEKLGLDVTPFPVGYKVSDAYMIGDRLKWHDVELPAIEDCDPDTGPQPPQEQDPLAGITLDADGQPMGGGLSFGGSSGVGMPAGDAGIGGSVR